jgi:hypothetical protein
MIELTCFTTQHRTPVNAAPQFTPKTNKNIYTIFSTHIFLLRMSLSPAQSDLLAPFLVPSLPPSFYYIPNFITPEEEAAILRKATKFPLSSSILTSPPSAVQKNPPQPPSLHSPVLHTIPTSRSPFPSRLARPTNPLPQHRSPQTAGPP